MLYLSYLLPRCYYVPCLVQRGSVPPGFKNVLVPVDLNPYSEEGKKLSETMLRHLRIKNNLFPLYIHKL